MSVSIRLLHLRWQELQRMVRQVGLK
jgi:hypothetical protein